MIGYMFRPCRRLHAFTICLLIPKSLCQVADYCAERMHGVIAEELSKESIDGYEWQKKWKEAFSSGFRRADDLVITEAGVSEMVGSTAVVAIVSGCQIILSNCGDSRAVLCRRTQTIQLTVDHKVRQTGNA